MGAPKHNRKDGKLVAKNRKAFYHFEVLEEHEAGLRLLGTEVKSLRDGGLSFGDGHARFRDGELFLLNVHIAPYKLGTNANHEPDRARKLLMKRRELKGLEKKVREKGLSLVPLAVYFNERGIAKLKLGLCRGKKLYDKRQAIAARDAKRQLDRARRADG